jgi:hypothetical protein
MVSLYRRSQRSTVNFDQHPPFVNPFFDIELKQDGCGSTHCRKRRKRSSEYLAGVEQPNNAVCPGIHRPDIGSLPHITAQARKGETSGVRVPSLFTADGVIDLTGRVRIFLVQKAALTLMIKTRGNQPPQPPADVIGQRSYPAGRAPSP